MEHRELTLGVLKRAREILSDPARWTKYVYARVPGTDDEDSNMDLIAHPDATCFCGLGALGRAAVEMSGQAGLSPAYDLDTSAEAVLREDDGSLPMTEQELAALYAGRELRITLLRSGRVQPPKWYKAPPEVTEMYLLNWIQFPIFNDHPDTTHADLLAVFDETIARLEATA